MELNIIIMKKMLSINASMVYGYKFVGWFSSLEELAPISKLNTYSTYKVVDDMTIFAVFEYDIYCFIQLCWQWIFGPGENLVQEIKYLHDGQSVTANCR